jgi:hypothetical protein
MSRLGFQEGVVTHADLVSSRASYLGAQLGEFSKRMMVVTSYQSLLETLGIFDSALYLPATTTDANAIIHEVVSDEDI